MSEDNNSGLNLTNGLSFPMIIAITALILSLTSGIVNYRQNNLSNLESSLRDTRDQLQLAKNDITDIRTTTVQQLVEAEIALKNQGQLKQQNSKLTEKLNESNIRMKELERQIRRMDHKITSQKSALRAAKRKINKANATKKKTPKNVASKAGSSTATNASANIDIYTKQMGPSLQHSITNAIQAKGFKPKFPKLLASMSLTKKTTVFYYHDNYQKVAAKLANVLIASDIGEVILRKGVSPYSNNKIIVHLIGQ